MDQYRYLYSGRSRLNDETGTQIKVMYYGKDHPKSVKANGYKYVQRMVDKIDQLFVSPYDFVESFVVKWPEAMTAILYHKVEFRKPADNMLFFVFNRFKDNLSTTYLTCWNRHKLFKLEGDPIKCGGLDADARIAQQKHFESLYQVDQIVPGLETYYCCEHDYNCYDLKLTVTLDFPYGCDLDKEEVKLRETSL